MVQNIVLKVLLLTKDILYALLLIPHQQRYFPYTNVPSSTKSSHGDVIEEGEQEHNQRQHQSQNTD